jgi:hypothetical protein
VVGPGQIEGGEGTFRPPHRALIDRGPGELGGDLPSLAVDRLRPGQAIRQRGGLGGRPGNLLAQFRPADPDGVPIQASGGLGLGGHRLGEGGLVRTQRLHQERHALLVDAHRFRALLDVGDQARPLRVPLPGPLGLPVRSRRVTPGVGVLLFEGPDRTPAVRQGGRVGHGRLVGAGDLTGLDDEFIVPGDVRLDLGDRAGRRPLRRRGGVDRVKRRPELPGGLAPARRVVTRQLGLRRGHQAVGSGITAGRTTALVRTPAG